jgi:hypothetical protein
LLASAPEVSVEPQERFDRVTTPSGVAASRRHAMRLVRDNEDFVLVYELAGPELSDARSLVIEWNGGRQSTRLYEYPSNWRQLRDAELLAMRRLQDT